MHQSADRSGGDAAIDEKSLPGDVDAGLGREKNDSAIEIVGLAWTFHRDAIGEVVHPLLIFVQNFVLLGAKPTRRQAIYGNAVFAPVVGQAHRQLADAAAARSVRTESLRSPRRW